jgi:hypothetical protein
MAAFRKISVSFWSDSFVGELTPERKYFYLYLMTNDKTTQCGIYETSIRKMAFDTGYNTETIQKLLDFFQESNKIRWSKETNEVALLNWVKFNESNSPKVLACIEKELKQIKNRVLIQYLYSMDTESQKEEEEEKEEEKEKEQEEAVIISFRDELFNKWYKYKSEKRSSYTKSGKAQLIKDWQDKKDQELEQAINHSMANNYQGLFEPKKSVDLTEKKGKFQTNLENISQAAQNILDSHDNGTYQNPFDRF